MSDVDLEPVASGAPGPEPRRRPRSALLIAGVVAVVAVLLVVLLATSPQGDQPTSSPLLGKLAPDIKAKDTTGSQFRIDDYRGRWVLVNFFATWCGPCVQEHPELLAFARKHALSGDAAVVSVAFNEAPSTVEKFFQKNGGDWPVIAQGNGQFALDYGVVKLPESYLIGPDGTVVEKFDGGIQSDQVDATIAKLSGASK